MEPEINTQYTSPIDSSHKKKNITAVVIVLIILMLSVFYAQKMGWIFKKSPVSVYSAIAKFQELAQQKDYDSCITVAEKQIQDNSKNVLAWQWKGICEFESGKYEEAKKSFEQIQILEPDHGAAKNYLELMLKGDTLINLQKDGISRESFETLSKLIFPVSFDFEGAYTISIDEKTDSLTGTYVSSIGLEKTKTEIQNSLKFSKLSYKTETFSTGVVVYKISSLYKNYSVSLISTSEPIRVTVRFLVRK
ncbi:hypothetical protein A3B85_02025 [Candidatus Nomurabacteria bacterium RIFCSPHIGHO2_02_FULL_37_13]|uniref:Uncharacterized protein n=1 Tax=Candidatus Nomurabacteria bacterium RIFCSPHIGHO2_02_FULL_37_13 TaxID=1801750 RepID=A0A1F6W4P0_9BACT|nr:MAG: hypothetical protein A2640_00795 [Candidatus Nomurabacteria bacterium RIFCSPHIGHO2_01_FULL_36_23]OGI76869.1 MAG: hypothetical protein A3B85_02025 [Candidatus Nomurabacteria bacterium RIFCSPHIGHO2_02_FULL_37_13]OGI87840.1 MAG: hypothetical protein A2906_02300 [Candidatus Nomurabacteria bacterium RIFCSPLOWO2_01_FULL_37_25]